MQLFIPIKALLDQIESTLTLLNNEIYTKPSKLLHGATIGQHVRHIIELFIELHSGYENGIVNYELRKRDYKIETDIDFAKDSIHSIVQQLNKPDKNLQLKTNYSISTNDMILVQTNYYRELIYNLEHTVHHMALIRVSINEFTNISLEPSFGVAVSTIKHKNGICVQ
ncbi:MAG: hypothetical protein Q8K64_01850 [Sediminibacterium sp.]|nr:hypothetical protein [Sediminibacterium sp.]